MITYVTSETIDRKTDEWLRAIQPFTKGDPRPDPSKSALLVIDCQNFFLGEGETSAEPVLKKIRQLIKRFHAINRPVIFTRHMHKPDGSDLGMLAEFWDSHCYEGTDGSEIHSSLDVGTDDFIVDKNRYSGFINTNLDDILKKLEVKELIITGVMTNLCCETTSRDAFCRDYRVFFPADANGTACEEMHFASLMNLAFGFATVLRTSDILESI